MICITISIIDNQVTCWIVFCVQSWNVHVCQWKHVWEKRHMMGTFLNLMKSRCRLYTPFVHICTFNISLLSVYSIKCICEQKWTWNHLLKYLDKNVLLVVFEDATDLKLSSVMYDDCVPLFIVGTRTWSIPSVCYTSRTV